MPFLLEDDGTIDTIQYLNFLFKHDVEVGRRNDRRPQSLTIRPGERYDDICVPDRLKFLAIDDDKTWFIGYG